MTRFRRQLLSRDLSSAERIRGTIGFDGKQSSRADPAGDRFPRLAARGGLSVWRHCNGARPAAWPAKQAYAAFSAGDAEGAMSAIADDVKWITPGNSAISGTVLGKHEVGALWAKLAEKGFATSPQFWFSDEDRVVVLTQISVGGEQADQVDVLTYRDGKLVKFQTAGDTALFERVFGSK